MAIRHRLFLKGNYDLPSNSKEVVEGELHDWQAEAYKKLRNARHTFVTAYCGSGKSTLQVALGIREVEQSDYRQRQLIVVPQAHIANGFIKKTLKLDGKRRCWFVSSDNIFCDADQTVAGLKQWLLARPSKARIGAISSHQTLGLVWKQLTDDAKRKALRNLSIRIDEAHHIKGVFDQQELAMNSDEQRAAHDEATNLGRVCHDALNGLSHKTTRVHLTTATPFRGDQAIIMSSKAKEMFTTYNLSWDAWYPEIGLKKGFGITYEDYSSFSELVKLLTDRIGKEKRHKHWIMIPATGSEWRTKHGSYKAIEIAIRRVWPRVRFLDLVGENTKEIHQIRSEPAAHDKHPSQIDVIVSCRLGLEGTDWCPCDRLHNLCVDGSVTMALQKWGRVFRQFPGKTSVKMRNYVRFPEPSKDLTPREILSDRTNALLSYLTVADMMTPLLLRRKPVGKEDEVREIQEEFAKEAIEAVAAGRDTAPSKEKAKTRLADLGLEARFIREAGFDHIIERAQGIVAGTFSKKQTHALRSILAGSRKTPAEWAKIAKTMAADNGNLIPNIRTLSRQGLHGLIHAMNDHPSLFAGIPRARLHHSVDDWEVIAVRLANKNGGRLQNMKWLERNGFGGLAHAIRSNRKRFSKFRQIDLLRVNSLPQATALAKANNGYVPSTNWLKTHGYSTLARKLRKPEFSHLKQAHGHDPRWWRYKWKDIS